MAGLVQGLHLRPGAYPKGEHLKVAPQRYTLALLTNSKLGWKGPLGTNTSLLGQFVSNEEKSFVNTMRQVQGVRMY